MSRTECPQCSTGFRYGDEQLGKKIKCPKCGHSFRLPGPAAPAEEGSSEPAHGKSAGSPGRWLYWSAAGVTLVLLACGAAGYFLYERMNSRVNSTNAKIITAGVFSREGMTITEAEEILGPGLNNGAGPGGQWFETIWGSMGGEHIRVRYGPGGRISMVSVNVKGFDRSVPPRER